MDDARTSLKTDMPNQGNGEYTTRLDNTEPKAVASVPANPPTVSKTRLMDESKADAPPPKSEDADANTKPDEKPAPRWKRVLKWSIGLLVVVALTVGGILYWSYSRHYETTDDAFIDGHIVQVSAQVAARVVTLDVQDNQKVRTGDKLLSLDARDYQVKLDQARAQRTQAVAQLDQARAQIGLQQANVAQAAANVRVTEADLAQAQSDLSRYRAVDPKAITRQQVDNASATTRSAQARLDANRQAVVGTRAQLAAQQAMAEAAKANVHIADVAISNAELQVSYNVITAPQDGRVTKRTVEVGNYVNPGQSLLAIVSPDVWVTANFKETQLAAMRVGQIVRIQIDACPDLYFSAKVNSFQDGSGNAFSSLPAENATGNYVKVVQRVPVKIVFTDNRLDQCHMAPGMSVAPRVTVR